MKIKLKKQCFFIFLFFPLFLWGQGAIPPTGGTATGTTVGQSNDCTIRSTEDYYYEFTPIANECGNFDYTISLCNTTSGWDSYMYLYETNLCNGANLVSDNDDNCGLLSEISYSFTPGLTYYILLEGFNAPGAYQLDVFPTSSPPVLSGDYYLLGDASAQVADDCYILTQDNSTQTSCIWGNSTFNFAQAFSTEFTINLGSNDGGADGMALVFHNDPNGNCACGTGGESLAYGGSNAINNSLIFEIDTYINTEDRDDFSFPCISGTCSDPDHSAIHINGVWQNPVFDAEPLMDGAIEYDIENGMDHLLLVSWDGTSINFSITNMSQTQTYVSLSYAFDPLTLFGTNTPLFGFTGSTGLFTNEQRICFPETCTSLLQFIKK